MQKNIERLDKNFQDKIKLFDFIISSNEEQKAVLISEHGTAHCEQSDSSNIQAISIDNLINNVAHVAPQDCCLIKIDTDGYDWDCILSGKNFFSQSSALIFWENFYEKPADSENYIKACEFLIENGYKKFYIFNNYGGFICPVHGNDIVYLLKYYAYSFNTPYTTYPYYDILACKNDKIEFMDTIMNSYIEKYQTY